MNKSAQILKIVEEKGVLKQLVFDNTLSTFNIIKSILNKLSKEYNQKLKAQDNRNWFEYRNEGIFQCEFKVAGDLLVFYMHTNVFEFDRDHKIWSLPIAKQDKDSTYSGVISVYNFLSDSFKYSRQEDAGYLIARIFINNKKHFFVEGKQQMGYLSNNFGSTEITEEALRGILESAILYSQKFDLLVPPYDSVKIVNVNQILESRKQGIQTGKRLGFSFNSDDISGSNLLYTGG
ncbi:MAG: hypothetical protein JXL97_04345 [Bacteroidales bacterium]|nr:hypothetical protein [Bacteroidales bacterium]